MISFKKICFYPLVVFLIFATLLYFFCEAHAQTLLKGAVRTVIKKGQLYEININTPINFYYSQIGDDVSALLTSDILLGEDLYIPKGSRIGGVITNIKKPKHFGQNGSFEIDFTEIITKDNLHIPIFVSISTDTSSKIKKVADILTYDSLLVAYGTFHGAITGIQYGGVPLAITSHGISVLGGASLGAGAGLLGSVVRKGKIPTVLTFSPREVVLKSDFYILGELPKITEYGIRNTGDDYKGFRFFPKAKKEEIELIAKNIKNEHSDTYGNYLVVEFYVKNNSQKKISLFDLSLISTRQEEPLHPDLFLSGKGVLKTIYPNEEINASLAFLITDKMTGKNDNYSLALIDPLDNEEIVKVPLNQK